MAKSKEHSARKRKKKANSLLLEPTIEEEQLAELASSSMNKRTGDRNDNQFSIYGLKNQSKSSSSSSKNVIPVYNNGELTSSNRCERESCKKPSDGVRAKRSELTTLLTLIFGLQMILLVSLLPSSAHSQAMPPNSTSLSASTSVPRTTVKNSTVAQADSLSNLTSALIKKSNPQINGTSTELPINLPGTTLIPDSLEASTPSDADENLADGDNDEEIENENSLSANENASSGNAGRSTSALLLNTANEAAEQLINRIKTQGAVADGSESAADDAPGELGEAEIEERRIDRRDNGEPSVISSKQLRSIETGDRSQHPTANTTTTTTTTATKQGKTSIKSASDELRFAMETYSKWRDTGNEIIELLSRKVLPIVVEHGYDVDAVTVTGLLQLFNGIRALKPWALKVLDASAKLTPGLLVGTQSDFGDYDECLNVRVDDPSGLQQANAIPVEQQEFDPQTGLPTSTVIGRYCLADIEFPKPPRVRLATRNEELQTDFAPIELRTPLFNFSQSEVFKDTIWVETANFFHMLYVDPIRVGICLTNKIDPDNFAQVLNKLTKHLEVSINFHGRCVTKFDKPTWTTYQVVSAYVLVIACSLVALCTLLDLLHTKLNKLPLPVGLDKWKFELRSSLNRYRPLFTSFSLIRNTKRLFKSQANRLLPGDESKSFHSSTSIQQYNLNLQHSMARCSTSVSGSNCPNTSSSSSESSESSPSIERRSSTGSSALNLISDTSLIASATSGTKSNNNSKLQDCQLIRMHTSNSRQHLPQKEANNLLCLHGIRVITMIWMIVNHTYLFGGFFVLWAHRRLIDIAEWPKSISFQLVLNGWLTVETYFFLSAAIIVLNVMPLMKRKRFSYLPYILHRLLRLLPAYTGLICLNFLWPLISSGPVWLVKGKSFIQTPCEDYLWTNFLFINNWIWPEKQCMVHTWFLSADFQLYLLAPIIVYSLYRRPVLGHSLNLIVALLASLLSGFVIYANKLMPSTLINKLEFDSIKQQLSYSYFATYQHMGPYCLGIFIGYLLHKQRQINLPRHITWLLWLFLPPLSFTTLLLTYLWNGAYEEPTMINPSPLVSAFYVAIHRTIWTSLLAWIVFACATGRAKLISSFLSHPIFIPISRLSFSIYLVHLPVIMFRALNLRHTIEWTDSNILWEACGNFIVSLIFGYFLNIAFESPIINLERVVFGRANGDERVNVLRKQVPANDNCKLASHIDTTDLTSEDDDKSAKSGQSSQIAPKTSASSDGTNSQETSPRQLHWTEYGINNQQVGASGSLNQRKSFRPKQNSSVEDIFGNQQMEPLSLAGKTALAKANMEVPLEDLPPSRTTLYQQMAPKAEETGTNVRRFSSYDSPSRTDIVSLAAINNVDSLTSGLSFHGAVGENNDGDYDGGESYYKRARANHLRSLQRYNYSRSTQYATLARSSRFNHYNQFEPPRLDRLDYHQRLSQLFALPAKPRSHLGDSSSLRPTSAEEGDNEQDAVSQTRALNHRAHLFHRRRQGQYNTLTGAGVQEWRRRHTDVVDRNWHVQRWNGLERADSQASSSNYLQSGIMIPRIDSSTLRRQTNRKNELPGSSIQEEPAFEEREDAAL